jgi:hypothetical protein
MMKPMGAR